MAGEWRRSNADPFMLLDGSTSFPLEHEITNREGQRVVCGRYTVDVGLCPPEE